MRAHRSSGDGAAGEAEGCVIHLPTLRSWLALATEFAREKLRSAIEEEEREEALETRWNNEHAEYWR